MAGIELITLSSADGQRLLHDARSGLHGSCCQQKLIDVFTKQVSNSSCGLVSSALVLSAFHVDESTTSKPPFTEQNMLSMPATLSVISSQKLLGSGGMRLVEVGDLLKAHGGRVTVVYAADDSVETFRHHCIEVLSHSNSSCAITVNYSMAALGHQFLLGHHSPLAAYHAASDRVLLLDVWPQTAECWATVNSVYTAMNTVDSDTGKSRGYCIAQF